MKMIRNTMLALLFGTFLPISANADEVDAMAAVEAAEQAVTSLLSRVREVRPYYESDEQRYFQGIEEEVTAFVDFREVAIGVMARFSRDATDAQIDAFADKLRGTLTRFYGSALVDYGDQQITYMPPQQPPADPAAATNVRLQISGDGARIDLQSTMFLNDEGEWKLRNLFVGGINLRRQYHTQFAALMSRHGNDIDVVIENWQ
jgi:phospholipid transport system substrate-binding protein